MTKIYLDDCRQPADPSWIVVCSYDEFVDWITKNGLPDFISFDYDLQEGKPNGYDCVIWLISNDLLPINFSVHSENLDGGDRILNLINEWQDHNGIHPRGYKTFWELKIDEDEIQ